MKKQTVWVIEIILAVTVSFLLLFHIWECDFTVLLENREDAIGLATQAQNDVSGIEREELYGMPYEEGNRETIVNSVLTSLFLKLLTICCDSFGTAGNILYLTGYLLAAVCMYAALKMMRIHNAAAAALCILFAFLPYHYYRGECHLSLGMYYMVPFICLLVLWIMEGKLRLGPDCGRAEKKLIAAACVAAFTAGLLDIYYIVFSCILLLFSGLAGSVKKKDLSSVKMALLLCFVMCLPSLVVNIPAMADGSQIEETVAARGINEFEMYGMRIAQLLLPVQNHRISALARIRAEYDRSIPDNETKMATLGLIMSIGFYISLVYCFLIQGKTKMDEQLRQLGLLNLVCVLLGTIGGFNIFVGMIFSTVIRAYNRLSVFIAAFSTMTAALVLQNLYKKAEKKGKKSQTAFFILLSFLLVFGLLDQTPPFDSRRYQENLRYDSNTRGLVQQIQACVPEDSMIFMLPILTDGFYAYQMRNYEQQWPALYSDTLRWSTSKAVGVKNKRWKECLRNMETEEMLEQVSAAGFAGIWLDENGYGESEFEQIRTKLDRLLGEPALVSESGKQFFYPLWDYTERLRNRYGAEIWNRMKQESLELGNEK